MNLLKTHKNNIYINEIKNIKSLIKADKIAVLVDNNTKKYCLPNLSAYLKIDLIISISSGEKYKNLQTCEYIWEELNSNNFKRNDVLLNLGGGVICDIGGFVASTYKRGIEFINIPTTLLAMVDASIGGKTGVNFKNFKNNIGVFSSPKLVGIDINFLETLPSKEFNSAKAEIFKHALIECNAYWRDLIKTEFSPTYLKAIINKSVEIKLKLVELDPFDKKERKKLNFGHTIGHALESYFIGTENKLLHGEAVAIGMICESFISYSKKLITIKELEEITEVILTHFKKIDLKDINLEKLTHYLFNDKKNEKNSINTTLLNGIGSAVINQEINFKEAEMAINYYSNF